MLFRSLKLDSGYVLACVAAERASQPEIKAAWAHTAEVLYGLAAALAVVALLPFIHLPPAGLAEVSLAFDNNIHYAKYKKCRVNSSTQVFNYLPV